MAKKIAHDRIFTTLDHAFRGQKLLFTPFRDADPQKFGEFMHADGDAWITYLGGKPVCSEDPAAELAHMNRYARGRGNQFDFFVQRTQGGPYIAYGNVMLSPHRRDASIGYYVLPSHRGQNVATDIAGIFSRQLGVAACRIGLDGIVARVRDDNHPSLRVMKKAGFSFAGTVPSAFGRPGTYLSFAQRLEQPTDRHTNGRQ